MHAIKYLFLTEFKNIPKKMKSAKGTAGLTIFIVCYLIFVPILFSYIELDILRGRNNFMLLLAIGAFFETPYIALQFLERKGIVFKSPDIHYLLPSPVSPKEIIVYGKNKHILTHVLSQIYVVSIGYFVFKTPFVSCLLYVVLSLCIGIVRDTSLAILLYGGNKNDAKTKGLAKGLIYGVIACMCISLVRTIISNPFGAELISTYFTDKNTLFIPLVGWEIALIQLCILGPTKTNLLLTTVYVVFTALLAFYAYKMPCDEGFYEDAAIYTEQFEYAIQKRKLGGAYFVGQKNKRKKASVVYKKDGANAFYYKSLLEYLKMPGFLFSSITFIMAFTGLLIGFSDFRGDNVFSFPFCVLLLLVFLCIVFQGFGIRWKKDILSPYFRLIPGKTRVKLFGIVVFEYEKALLESIIFVLIVTLGVGEKYIPYAILTAVIYTCVRSSRMHLSIICQATVSKFFGKFGTTIIEYASILFVIIPVCGLALAGGMFGKELIGFTVSAIVAVLDVLILFAISCFAANRINY